MAIEQPQARAATAQQNVFVRTYTDGLLGPDVPMAPADGTRRGSRVSLADTRDRALDREPDTLHLG